MSGLGVHVNQSPTGLGAFLQETNDVGSVVPALFALDINIAPDVDSKSPDTLIVFRTQQFGPDNGAMYQGDPIAAGRARVDQCLDKWHANPAQFYAADNEPGRSDIEGLTWLCNYYLGEMQRADELGVKLCIGEWSTGMPPISAGESSAIVEWLEKHDKSNSLIEQHRNVIDVSTHSEQSVDYISIYTPMLRYAAQHGHILGLHEYSLYGPMIGSPLCLRYRTLLEALPADARSKVMISEAGPGAGYATGYTMQAYIDTVAAYDAEIMKDIAAGSVVGCALFKLGKGESNMVEVMPLLTDYVASHPTPPPQVDEREYVRVVHLIPPSLDYLDNGNLDPRMIQIVKYAAPGRESIVCSADDAFLVADECIGRKVYVYNVDEYGGKPVLEAWVKKYYAPLPEIIYRTV